MFKPSAAGAFGMFKFKTGSFTGLAAFDEAAGFGIDFIES
jgi:hypothetical protein